MILIKNSQRTISVNLKQLERETQMILAAVKYPDFALSIWLTTNATIRRYNKKFRHKDKPTDILSFPFYPELKPGEKIKAPSDEEKILGDLIISLQYVKKDAPRYKVSFELRLRQLLVHGICHLLGYDHETDEDYAMMYKKELALLKKIG